MAEDPNQLVDASSGFGSALALFRRLSSQTVASTFQPQQRDQFGFLVYNRSNATIANLSTPLGANAVASGNRSTAIGAFANAREDSSTAVGIYAQAFGPSSVAIGDQAKATAYRGIAIGALTNVTSVRAIAIGNSTYSSGRDNVVIGTQAKATNLQSIVIGLFASASNGNSSITIGQNASTTGGNEVAIGTNASSSGTINQLNTAIGAAATIGSNGDSNVLIGFNTGSAASVANGTALGANCQIGASNSVAIGNATSTTTVNTCLIGNATTNLNTFISGNLAFPILGTNLYFKEGAAVGTSATYGRVTLSGAGTAIIYSTKISATSTIMLTPQNASGTAGSVSITTSTAGIKATVGSTSAADTRTVAWLLLESA